MGEASIPVDLFNPGQVFACLGFMEAAEVLLGEASGGFDWRDPARTVFRLRANGAENPFESALKFIAGAEVRSIAPHGSKNRTSSWDVETEVQAADQPFPYPDPKSPATLPAVLIEGSRRMVLDSWGDETQRDAMKFWGGAAGYPGAALLRDALGLVRDSARAACADPFSVAFEQSSSFRFDWRRDYIPIDAGFSLNSHGSARIAAVGYPLVEIFAAIGLTHARAKRLKVLEYQYSILGDASASLSPVLMRAALGGSPLPFPQRWFDMFLGWPAQEGQARCITRVIECLRSPVEENSR